MTRTDTTTSRARQDRLEQIYEEARRLESEIEGEAGASPWPPRGYYLAFHLMAGALLGFVGAASSLLFNVVGSLLIEQFPLQIIRVYLTFPLGEPALSLDSGAALGIGTCLYLATGSLYGILFHIVMSRGFETAPAARRFAVATALGLAVWVVNFYFVLSWLQPALFGGNWIVRLVPFWVAAATHLVFAWTMLLLEGLGKFVPYTPARS